MPISLFLDNLTPFRLHFLEVASAWDRLLSLESLLIRRARGAFMVRWFGAGLPVVGTALGIALNAASLALLKRKLAIVVRQMLVGPNLLEPLAGLFGSLIGPVIGNAAFLIGVWFVCVSTIAAILGGIGGAALVGSFALANSPTLIEVQRMTAAAAQLIPALTQFWKVVTGPRDQVRNPALRAMLEVLDSLAPLLAHLVGAVAVVIQRFIPSLIVMLATLPAFVELMKAGLQTMNDLWTDLTKRLGEFFDGPHSPHKIFDSMHWAILHLIDVLQKQFKDIGSVLKDMWREVSASIAHEWDSWIARITPLIEDKFKNNAVMDRWRATIHKLYDMLAPSSGASSSGPGTLDKLQKYYLKAKSIIPLPDLPSTTVPSFSDLSGMAGGAPTAGFGDAAMIAQDLVNLRKLGILPDFDAMLDLISRPTNASGALPTPFDLSPDDRKKIDDMLRPRSLIAVERAQLDKQMGGNAAGELARRWQLEHDARDRLWSIIDRMLPAKAAGYFQQLEPMLERMDAELYDRIFPGAGKKKRAEALRGARVTYPVLDLREDDRLRLEARRARVRYRGKRDNALRTQIETFGSALRAALYGTEYLARPAS
ncbi:MAG: hypothetical protein U0Q18_27650 [Bryobacteraceae bacterium]